MSRAKKTPHLHPLPGNGERRMRNTVAIRGDIAPPASVVSIRLSLSQRQRIELTDCLWSVLPMRARLLAIHRRAHRGPGDSKTAGLKCPPVQEPRRAHGHACDQFDSCDRHRQVQWPVSQLDNRNRLHIGGLDAAVEIYNPQNFGSAGGSKAGAPILLHSSADNQRDPQNHSSRSCIPGKGKLLPQLNALPGNGERRTHTEVVIVYVRAVLLIALLTESSKPRCGFATRPSIRLSLSQRERMEVRDYFS